MDKQKGSIGDPQIIYKNMGGREGERDKENFSFFALLQMVESFFM